MPTIPKQNPDAVIASAERALANDSMRFSGLFELSNTAGTFDASEIKLLSAPLKSLSASWLSWRRRPNSSCRRAICSRFLS